MSVSAGTWHGCGVKADGSVLCWGSDDDGESTPPDDSFTSVSAGGSHTCGVKIGGSVLCWGSDDDGESTPPDDSFASVSAGGDHTCGVKTDGSVACWGGNDDGQSTPPSGPFASVSAGLVHSCGVKTDGSVVCWGFDRPDRPEPGGATPPKKYSAPPSMTIDPDKRYTATFNLAKGESFVVELFAKEAPTTVNNFVFLGPRRLLRRRDLPPCDPRLHGPGRRPDRHRDGRAGLYHPGRVQPAEAPRQPRRSVHGPTPDSRTAATDSGTSPSSRRRTWTTLTRCSERWWREWRWSTTSLPAIHPPRHRRAT